MKRYILPIILGLCPLYSVVIIAQCTTCNFASMVVQDPNSPCCFDIKICNQGDPAGCMYNEIQILTNVFQPNIAEIGSATPGNANISANVTGTYSASFTSNVPFTNTVSSCLLNGDYTEVGKICLTNPAEPTTSFELYAVGPNAFCLVNSDELQTACPQPTTTFDMLCGDNTEQYPTKLKSFGDGMYVASVKNINGLNHGVFTKYDKSNGMQVWSFVMQEASVFNDFEYIPASDEFLLVGATEPFTLNGQPQDNQSLLVRVDDNGVLIFANSYQQLGRESFNRIIRHPNPQKPAFPYYIVGTKNPPANPPFYPNPPSGTDRVVAFCINESGGVLWANEYDYNGTIVPDDEFHRGLFAVNTALPGGGTNGDIVITGNDSPTNNGIVVKLDGNNGNVMDAIRYSEILDIYDGVELANGNIALVGADFGNDMAFIAVVNASFQFNKSRRIFTLHDFREIGLDANDHLYACGLSKGPGYPVMCRFQNDANLTMEYAHYLADGETAWKNCRFSVTPAEDFIFYADGRKDNPSGFGDFDLLTGAYDLWFHSNCLDSLQSDQSVLPLNEFPISVTATAMTLQAPTQLHQQPLNYACTGFCSPMTPPCVADFDYTNVGQGCFDYLFTSTSTPASTNFNYCWDADGLPPCEGTANSFNYQFPDCGIYNVCLTITDPSTGCDDTHCEAITIEDFIAPIFTNCPTSPVVKPALPPNCQACFDPMLAAIDNCGLLPQITYVLSGATTGNNANTCYNIGQTNVLANAIDICGNLGTCQFTVIVADNTQLGITCPPDLTISTNPGLCRALFTPPFTIIDNCDPSPVTSICSFEDANGNVLQGNTALLDKGNWTVTCTISDNTGSTNCSFAVVVEDHELPTISCPPNQTLQVPGCSNGSVAVFADPVFDDNCPNVSLNCTPALQSGDFFPCGTTTITCTATDMSGNTATCSHSVTVNGCHDCSQVVTANASCTSIYKCYDFSIALHNSTYPNLSLASDATVSAVFNGNGSFSYNWSPLDETGTLTGQVCLTDPGSPSTHLDFTVNVSFPNCQYGPIQCNLPVSIATPCCEEIHLQNQNVCKAGGTFSLPLIGDPQVLADLCDDAVQLDWFVDDNCDLSGFKRFQSTYGCSDLVIHPSYFPSGTTSLCVYAKMYLANNPCNTLTTNTVTLILCDQPTCHVESASMDYCEDGMPVTTNPLKVVVDSPSDCGYTVQWLDGSGNPIPGETGDFYSPGDLSHIPGNNNDCFTQYHYTAEVTTICGVQLCPATITIYNGNALPGAIMQTHPSGPPPYCPGQDFKLGFKPECPEINANWAWHISQTGTPGDFDPIVDAGNSNGLYYTNQLYADTWYEVEITNGVCPADRVPWMIDIYDDYNFTPFNAGLDDECEPTYVHLEIGFSPNTPADCELIVHWFKDGVEIGTTASGGPLASYDHFDPPFDGNYYAIVEDLCCGRKWRTNVDIVEPVFTVLATGPCFRCNDEEVLLQGIIYDLPSASNCTYEWQVNGVPIPGSNSQILATNMGDASYTFTVTCDSCTKSSTFFLRQCGEPCDALLVEVLKGYNYIANSNGGYDFTPIGNFTSNDEVTWDWGDGSALTATTGNALTSHQFSSSSVTDVMMTVERTFANGNTCIGSFTMELTGTTSKFGEISVSITPNPTSGHFSLLFTQPTSEAASLKIIGLKGEVMKNHELPAGRNQYDFSIAELPAGVYLVKIEGRDGQVWTDKIMKQ